MTLFLSKLANTGAALVDVFTIVRCDSALGSDTINAQVDRISYAKTSSGAGQDRIEALVQSAGNVVVSAVPNGTTIPDGSGGMIPVNLVGGATYPPDAAGLIQVVYCFDNAMFGFDAAGGQISLPRSDILFHELSHAFHRANGTFNAADPEFQAISDENTYRAQVGLPLRDPTNHNGGQGPGDGRQVPTCTGMGPAGPTGPTGPSPCCSC
ncbi:hypothetical protein [Aestuariivirga litoralis]|uniref:hypothetical protein n=1 Tax=Aestuariivirga litoralis TaxID=2650924 RepID=UPI0011B77B80|nr:hypothetical protein [Aestuariivirga litoralis]